MEKERKAGGAMDLVSFVLSRSQYVVEADVSHKKRNRNS